MEIAFMGNGKGYSQDIVKGNHSLQSEVLQALPQTISNH